jgi:hypothetical protein
MGPAYSFARSLIITINNMVYPGVRVIKSGLTAITVSLGCLNHAMRNDYHLHYAKCE